MLRCLRTPGEMTAESLPAAVKALAGYFRVPTPSVSIDARPNRKSRAYPADNLIVIAPRCWIERSLVHEFAHILAYQEGREPGHGVDFFETLVRVCIAWYGDLTQYPWNQEYLSVWTSARDSGLTFKAWAHRRRR